MIVITAEGRSMKVITPIDELSIIFDILACSIYNHNRAYGTTITHYSDLIQVYNSSSSSSDPFEIKYSDGQGGLSVFDYVSYFEQIDARYLHIVSGLSRQDISELDKNAEIKNMSIFRYFQVYCNPTCRIRICIGDTIEEIFFTQPIADRIAYLMYTKHDYEIIDVHCKDDDGTWIPYEYNIDEVHAIYQRFCETLSRHELPAIERFCEDNHFNDPLALYKVCHCCGKPTDHYNTACGKICNDIIYAHSFDCHWGADCPLCKFIIY